MDGWIKIGTELSTSKFDKQMSQLEGKLEKAEKKLEDKAKVKMDIDTDIEKSKAKIFELEKEYERLQRRKEELEGIRTKAIDSGMTPTQINAITQAQMEYASLDGQIDEVGRSLDVAYDNQQKLITSSGKAKTDYAEAANEVNNIKKNMDGVNIQRKQAEMKSFQNSIEGVGKTITRNFKQAARSALNIVLGIVGVQAAISSLRSASSELASYDAQYKANLDYIRFALTQAIAPVLRWIVSMVATILGYINAIAQAWFSINIFGNSSAKSFQSMNASAGGAAGSVRQMKKDLAGFDEMNVLSDQSSGGGGGGGGGGAAMPDFDLSMPDGNLPNWMKDLLKYKDEIIAGLIGIAAALVLLKLGLSPLKALGIGIAIAGIVYAVMNLLEYLKDPTWENLGSMLQGIGGAIIGIGIATGNLPMIIIGAIVLIYGTFLKYWETIKEKIQSGIDWIKGKGENLKADGHTFLGWFVQTFGENIQIILNIISTILEHFKLVFDTIIGVLKNVFTGNWKGAWEVIKNHFKTTWEQIKTIASNVWNFIKLNVVEPIKTVFTTAWNVVKTGASNAWEGIKSVFSKVGTFFSNTFSTAWNKVKDIFSTGGQIFTGIKDGIVNSFTRIVNGIIGGLNRAIATPFNAINNALSRIRNVNIAGVSPFSGLPWISVPSIPYLKTGAIVNLPNKGTFVGGGMAGESGREGVIPLTDSQAMAQLGREIGKNVLINLNNITQLNGRVINREVKQVSAEHDFAYNT